MFSDVVNNIDVCVRYGNILNLAALALDDVGTVPEDFVDVVILAG